MAASSEFARDEHADEDFQSGDREPLHAESAPVEQGLSLQPHVDDALSRIDINCIVVESIHNCNFSVSIADPQMPDIPLIAVSEGFCELTGYSRENILGQNCRFLNEGCDLKASDREGLRLASKSGRHFCALLPNIKADGTLFMNLLDMRGLCVGRNADGQERIFIVGVQADVSECGEDDMPFEHKAQLQCIADAVRDQLVSSLQETAIVTSESSCELSPSGSVVPYTEPYWVVGEAVIDPPVLGILGG